MLTRHLHGPTDCSPVSESQIPSIDYFFMKFSPTKCFTFLWPEKFVNRSLRMSSNVNRSFRESNNVDRSFRESNTTQKQLFNGYSQILIVFPSNKPAPKCETFGREKRRPKDFEASKIGKSWSGVSITCWMDHHEFISISRSVGQKDYIRKSCLLGRFALSCHGLDALCLSQLKITGTTANKKMEGKQILNIRPSFSAVTNINSWSVKSALPNVVSLQWASSDGMKLRLGIAKASRFQRIYTSNIIMGTSYSDHALY